MRWVLASFPIYRTGVPSLIGQRYGHLNLKYKTSNRETIHPENGTIKTRVLVRKERSKARR